MIRINLLPTKVSPYKILGQKYLALGVFVFLATGGACYYHYNYMLDLSDIAKNEKIIRANSMKARLLRKQKDALKVVSLKEKQELQKKYEQKLKTVNRIEKIRSNPVFALLELSRILSLGQLPTVDKNVSIAKLQLDPNWDPSPVYLTKLKEKDRMASIAGYARSMYDVSELAKRLKASAYFRNPQITDSKVIKDEKTKSTKVAFTINVQMVY